jgi:hypothetical protein
MKKYLVLILLFMLILSGCSDKTIVPAAGDFSFDLPDGYSVTNTTDKNCSIVRDEDEVVVGGIEVTALKCKDVNGSKEVGIKTFKVLAEVFGVVYELLMEKKIKNSCVAPITWKAHFKIAGKGRTQEKKMA